MTEMQILRNALFDEIARVKRGTANTNNTKLIITNTNTITQTYNTELKACDTMIRAEELGFDLKDISINIFKEDDDKKLIDYKANDEDLH